MTQVSLNVYDLSAGLAKNLSMQMVGKQFDHVYHTGIVAFGREYFFGGGIMNTEPAKTPYGNPINTIPLGDTQKTKHQFDQWVSEQNSSKYALQNYDFFTRNCNHFTSDATKFLCGEDTDIPDEIKNQPEEFRETEMGKMAAQMMDQFRANFFPQQQQQQQQSTNQMPSSSGMVGGGMGGGMGGMADMMNNPMMQQMLNNPQLMQQAMNQFGGMGGGGMGGGMGGMSDMMNNPMVQQMLNNPQLMQQAMNQFGGMGGGGMGGGMGSGMGGGMGGSPFGNSSSFNPYGSTTQQQSTPPPPVDTKEVFRYKVSKVPNVVKKLKEFLQEANVSLSQQEQESLTNIEQYLTSTSTSKNSDMISQKEFDLLVKVMRDVKDKPFPALDLLRLLVLTPSLAQKCVADQSNGPLAFLLSDIIPQWKSLPMPTQLMTLRVFCNLFAATVEKEQQGGSARRFIVDNETRFNTIVDMVTHSLTSPLEGLRLTAASLACNLSLFAKNDGNDEETQLLCSMVEFIGSEKEASVAQRMLLCIYRLVSQCSEYRELAKNLGADVGKWKNKEKSRQIATAVEGLLK